MNILQRIKQAFSQARLRDIPAGGVQQMAGPRILDGVNYLLPIPMPVSVRGDTEKEAAWLHEATDAFRHQFGTPYVRGGPFIMPPVVDPLVEWDQTTRKYVLEQCHLAHERNPIAAAAVFYNRAFSVQNGASLTFKNKDVEAVVDAFMDNEENAVRELEKGMIDALQIDGEVFLRFFTGRITREAKMEDGKLTISEAATQEGQPGETVVVPLVPWGVVGIRHKVGFWRRVEAYHYQITLDSGDPTDPNFDTVDEYIPAQDVHHIAINRMIYERRGRPELFKMLPWLQAHKEWLENRARQNFWRGALLFWVKLLNATPAQVLAKLAAYKQPPSPGSLVVTNQNEEWNQFAPNVGAADAGDDGRQLRAMAATGSRLPESWLSDGSNANLATASAQALPAIKSFGEFQDIMRDQFWKPVLRRVIQNAIDAGVIQEMVEVQGADGNPIPDTEPIKAVDAVSVIYPELENGDPKNVVDAVLAALAGETISMQTARGLMPWPIDPNTEKRQIDAEKQEAIDDMISGKTPMPPGFGGGPVANNNGGNNANDSQTNSGGDGQQPGGGDNGSAPDGHDAGPGSDNAPVPPVQRKPVPAVRAG